MNAMDTRIDVRIPGNVVKKAAIKGMFGPNDPRSMIARFALLRLLPEVDDATALELARPNIGGRKKKSMAPDDDRIAIPISSEHLERIKAVMPEGTTVSQMTRYAFYRLQEWSHDDALEAATDYTRNTRGKSRKNVA